MYVYICMDGDICKVKLKSKNGILSDVGHFYL